MVTPSPYVLVLGLFLLTHSYFVAGEYSSGTVYIDHGVARFVAGKMDPDGAAYGFFNNTLNSTGWGIFEVKAGHDLPTENNNYIMYAAGFLEGIFTARQMDMQYLNLRQVFLGGKPKKIEQSLRAWLKKQDSWMRQMIMDHASSDPYWKHVSYIVSHYDGLWGGYREARGKNETDDIFVLQLLNGAGDLLDLVHALHASERPDFSRMSKSELLNFVSYNGHCSALVKVRGAFEDVYMSHSSWFTYQATNRIYKHYNFNINDPLSAAKKMSFSSYPGFLESLDDFYILGSQMVVLQTTNNIFDTKLYDHVTPASLLAWQRVRVANMMANNGEDWSNLLAKHNSGTYNNQYMVIDLKQIVLGKIVKDNALWVVEQIPTLVEGSDETQILRTGYWPSYNVPFFEGIYNKSGYPSIVKRAGEDLSYQLAPRAKIFRRDAGDVHSMSDMMNIMRYNNYTKDPYAEHNPCNTICCRGDLSSSLPRPDGCYDTKVTSLFMAKRLESIVINGPTTTNGLKPFSWNGKFKESSHIGLPQEYNFPWVHMKPSL